MRRFDVYFLQKRAASGWETLERAQSASVLVSSVVRAFDGEEDAELRVVGGDWNATIGEWEFSQIFFVDRASIDLALAEPSEATRGEDGTSGDDRALWAAPAAAPAPAETADERFADEEPAAPAGGGFADAIHAAREVADRADGEQGEDQLEARLRANAEPETRHDEAGRQQLTPDDDETTNEDLRSLGFTRTPLGLEEPVGPPPDFRPEPRRRGRAFFMIGTVLISLILIVGAAIALMIAFKVDPAPRYIGMFKEWRAAAMDGEQAGAPTADMVMPQTVGDSQAHKGVASALRGRWSYGDCREEFIEFGSDGFVVKAKGRDPSIEVPVSETLEDEYTWYIRRSTDLVEHFQKLGPDDIQMIGDTTPVGFTQRTSEVFTRCRQ